MGSEVPFPLDSDWDQLAGARAARKSIRVCWIADLGVGTGCSRWVDDTDSRRETLERLISSGNKKAGANAYWLESC